MTIPIGYLQAADSSPVQPPSKLPISLQTLGDVIPEAYYQRVNGIFYSSFPGHRTAPKGNFGPLRPGGA